MNLSCKLRGTTTVFDSVITKGWKLAAGMLPDERIAVMTAAVRLYEQISCPKF